MQSNKHEGKILYYPLTAPFAKAVDELQVAAVVIVESRRRRVISRDGFDFDFTGIAALTMTKTGTRGASIRN
jgi:hypothetical protein